MVWGRVSGSNPQLRLKKIPQVVIEIIKIEAEKAFNLLLTKDPSPSLLSLKQRPDEAFLDILDRV